MTTTLREWIACAALLSLSTIFQSVLSAQPAPAGCGDEGRTCVTARRITNASAPLIDGDLSDPAWTEAGRLAFPNPVGMEFPFGGKRHAPSPYTLLFLHDDINLYVAVETHDSMVESADVYTNSDGLQNLTLERKTPTPETKSFFQLVWYQAPIQGCVIAPGQAFPMIGPPLDSGRMPYDAEWRCKLRGTWNQDADTDDGFVCEISIPLADRPGHPAGNTNGPRGLGGWRAGDRLRANLAIMDHDENPNGRFDDQGTSFVKMTWGENEPENLGNGATERFIYLSDALPLGAPGDDRTIVAPRIDPSLAPRIDGIPSETVWNTAGMLRFPASVGRTFMPSQAAYNGDDPSTYTVYFLHDGKYLYVAAKTEDDRRIESATDQQDQASDGLTSFVVKDKNGSTDHRYAMFWHKLDLLEIHTLPAPIHDCDGLDKQTLNLHFQQGPPRYPYETQNVLWAPSLAGTWNDNRDLDRGYSLELRIPLADIGGYKPGELMEANISFVDHDGNPNGTFDACASTFKQFWWGFPYNEFFVDGKIHDDIDPSERRFIMLSDAPLPPAPSDPRDAKAKAIDYIVSQQLPYSGLIRSFPNEPVAHTYDLAVAMTAMVDANRRAEADQLAAAFLSVLVPDGPDAAFFYDAYDAIDKHVSQGTASGTGPNAWAALALWHYGSVFGVTDAQVAAQKVARWITRRLYDVSDGGVFGGVCHPFEELPADQHRGDIRYSFKSTEQVLDSWQIFNALPPQSDIHLLADSLKRWLTTPGQGWVELDNRQTCCPESFRFSTGVNSDCGADLRLFLDPQTWGAVFAIMADEPLKARQAIQAAERNMLVSDTVEDHVVTGFNDACLPKDGVVWYGGTAQMIVAYLFAGELSQAEHYRQEMATVQNLDGSWNHSSTNSDAKEEQGPCCSFQSFQRATPHVGETSWNYFALRDLLDGQRLPFEMSPSIVTRPRRRVVVFPSCVSVPAKPADWRADVFTPSDVAVIHGDVLTISASGSWDAGNGPVGPDGRPALCECPVSGSGESPLGALIGRIGLHGEPFLLGSQRQLTVTEDGPLFMAMNDNMGPCNGKDRGSCFEDNHGTLNVCIQVQRR